MYAHVHTCWDTLRNFHMVGFSTWLSLCPLSCPLPLTWGVWPSHCCYFCLLRSGLGAASLSKGFTHRNRTYETPLTPQCIWACYSPPFCCCRPTWLQCVYFTAVIVNHPNLCSMVADGHGRLRRNSFTPSSVIGRHLVICLDSNFNWGHLCDEMACGLRTALLNSR